MRDGGARRVPLERDGVELQRFRRVLPAKQGRALVQIGLGLLGIAPDRLVEIGDCRIDLAAPQLQDAAVYVSRDDLVLRQIVVQQGVRAQDLRQA